MLATLKRLKPMLYIDDTDQSQDDALTFALMSATSAIESYCNRDFERKTYTEIHSGGRSKFLALRNYPIHEIVEMNPENSSYISLDGGILFDERGWAKGEFNIKVTYIGGYTLPSDDSGVTTDLPAVLEMACLMLAKMIFKGDIGKVSERIEDYSVTYAQGEKQQDLPPVIQALCAPHVWRLG